MAKFNQNFPSLSQPLTGPGGTVNQSWLQFFLSLWNRTGAAEAAVNAVQVQYSAQGSSSLISPVGQLASVANGKLLANVSGTVAIPGPIDLSTFLDAVVGKTVGALLTRTSVGWILLAPGTANQVLTSQGTAQSLSWATVNTDVQAILDQLLPTDFDLIYFDTGSSTWKILAPGTAGWVLQTNGSALAPSWAPQGGSSTGADFLCVPAFNAHTTTTFNSGFWGGRSVLIPQTCTVSRIGFYATAASASSQLVPTVYDNSGQKPNGLLMSGPTVTGVTAGVNYLTLTSPLALTEGDVIWIGLIVQVANVSMGTTAWQVGGSDNAYFTNATLVPPNPASVGTYTQQGWANMFLTK